MTVRKDFYTPYYVTQDKAVIKKSLGETTETLSLYSIVTSEKVTSNCSSGTDKDSGKPDAASQTRV